MTFKNNHIVLFVLLAIFNISCGVYSFTGAALSPEIKSISIQNFYNESEGGPPNMAQLFSEGMRDYFQQNTSLDLKTRDGDLQFEGAITSFRISPIATQATGDMSQGDRAAGQRLTIGVKVSYVNTFDETASFDKTFSFYADFDANQPFTSVESQLIDEIFEQIILDIFNASVASW